MNDDQLKNKNFRVVSCCPICGTELLWLPLVPSHPDADYVGLCPRCNKSVEVSILGKKKK